MAQKLNFKRSDVVRRNACQKELDSLDEQLVHIQRERQRVQAKLNAFNVLIDGAAEKPPALDAARSRGFPVVRKQELREERTNPGLREAIFTVLKDAQHKLRPRDVTVKLRSGGFQDAEGNKTDLSVRVNNELWRLARAKRLVKRGIHYGLPAEELETS